MSISSITKSFLPVARHLPVTARSATHTFHRAIYTPPPHHLFKLERRFSTQPPGSAKASKVLNTDEKNLKTILDRATTTTDFLEIVRLVQDLRLDTDQLILVCHKLVEKGHAPKVSKHFIELGLAYRLSLKQKISLLDAITSSPQFSDKVATTLIENYSTLRLGNASEEERFHVLKKIIAKREITASKAVNNFSQFVYSSTLHKLFAQSKFMWYGPNLAEKPSEQFLLFLEEAARSGPQAVKAIIENYSHIGLPRATLTQRISLCCEMTKSGSEAACMVIQYFSRFCLDESSFEQKSPIFYEVGKSGSDAISEISKHFRQLGLDKVSTQERFCLFAKIAETNPESCRAILDLFDELDLKFTPLEDRFAFACRIVDLSWSSNPNDIEVLYRFDNLHLNELTIEQKLSFCHKIVNSKHSSPSLISYLKDLNLKDASVEQVFTLLEKIAASKSDAGYSSAKFLSNFYSPKENLKHKLSLFAKIIIANDRESYNIYDLFKELGFNLASTKERLTLFHAMAEAGPSSAYTLIKILSEFRQEDLSIEQKLSLLHKALATANRFKSYFVALKLLACFEDLGLHDAPLDQRMLLYSAIVDKGEIATDQLVKIPLFLSDLKRIPLEEKFIILRKIALSQSKKTADKIIENFFSLELEQGSLEEKFDFLEKCAAVSEDSILFIFEHFYSLGFDKATTHQKICLFNAIVNKKSLAYTEYSILRTSITLTLSDATPEQKYVICMQMATSSNAKMIATFLKCFSSFFLKEITPDKRLTFFETILEEHQWRVIPDLIQTLVSFPLLNDNSNRHFMLCRQMFKYGAEITDCLEALAGHASQLLPEVDDLLYLAQLFIAHNKQKIFFQSIKHTENAVLRRQIHLELWKQPSRVKYPSEHLADLRDIECLFDPELNAMEQLFTKTEKLKLLLPLLKTIRNENEHTQSILLNWIAYTARVLYDLSENQCAKIAESKFIEAIFAHKHPANRYIFTRVLSRLVKQDSIPLKKIDPKSKTCLLTLLPHPSPCNNPNQITDFLDQLSHLPDIGNITKMSVIIRFFTDLNSCLFDPSEIDIVFSRLLTKLTSLRSQIKAEKGHAPLKGQTNQFISYCSAWSAILKIFTPRKLISCLKDDIDPNDFLSKHFQDLFSIQHVENFGEKYITTLGTFRNTQALFDYLDSIKRLDEPDKTKTLKAFTDYVEAILNDEFPKLLYSTEKNPHLKQVFSVKGVQEEWTKCDAPKKITSKVESEELTPAQKSENYKNFLKTKIIVDKHIDPTIVPQLVAFLKEEAVPPIERNTPLDEFQNWAIRLCEGEVEAEDFIKAVQHIPEIGIFKNDLAALIPKERSKIYTVMESDDPCNRLLIGTEIDGSCQRVTGSPTLNKCLLSYMINGEVKPIVVIVNDKMIARAVMRLMWDKTLTKPVILLERIYSNVSDQSVRKGIIDQAIAKAKRMNLTLVSKEVGKSSDRKIYPREISYLGGRAPFVYSDASGGVRSGPFTVSTCHILYKPKGFFTSEI